MYVHDRSYSTIAILSREMRVIPAGPILGRAEAINFRIARRQSALRDSIDLLGFMSDLTSYRSKRKAKTYAVFRVRVQLAHTVPVERSAIVLHFVAYCDLESVPPISDDSRAWH
jgi:hypothetical protein